MKILGSEINLNKHLFRSFLTISRHFLSAGNFQIDTFFEHQIHLSDFHNSYPKLEKPHLINQKLNSGKCLSPYYLEPMTHASNACQGAHVNFSYKKWLQPNIIR